MQRVCVGLLPIDIAIREESSPARNCWPAALPTAFLVVFQGCAVDCNFITLWGRVADGLFRTTQELHRGDAAGELESWLVYMIGRSRMRK